MPTSKPPSPSERRPKMALIVAMARDNIIGKGGILPWHYPEDLRYFKAVTLHHPVIMGRKTYESILQTLGTPLPGRENIVLTRHPQRVVKHPHVLPVAHVDDAVNHARHVALQREQEAFMVIGGAEVYATTMPHAARLYVTHIDETYDGDARFPPIVPAYWRVQAQTKAQTPALRMVIYERISPERTRTEG